MRLSPIIVSLLLFGLFAIAIINGALLLSVFNSPNQTIANDPALIEYSNALNSTLASSYADANASETAIGTSPVTLSSNSGIIFDAIAGVWKTMKKAPVAIYNLTLGLIFAKIFADSQFAIVFAILGAILLIVIVFAVVELTSTGQGGGRNY